MSKTPLLEPSIVKSHLHSKSLSERVYDLIRDQIAAGRLPAGERLHQAKLAQEMGVGISTVREALMRLESEGFLESEAYKGFHVTFPTPEYQRDLGEILSALEQLAVGLAAIRITQEELARMRELLPRTIWGSNPDVSAVKQADLEFHRIIFQASQRPALIQLLEQVWDKYHVSTLVYYTDEDWRRMSELAAVRHRDILTALEAGDGERARQAVARLWKEDIALDEAIFARLFERKNDSG